MVFNTKQCWYLDNTFCAPLHSLSFAWDLGLRITLLVLWVFGFVLLGGWLTAASRRVLVEVRAAGADPGASLAGSGSQRREPMSQMYIFESSIGEGEERIG